MAVAKTRSAAEIVALVNVKVPGLALVTSSALDVGFAMALAGVLIALWLIIQAAIGKAVTTCAT